MNEIFLFEKTENSEKLRKLKCNIFQFYLELEDGTKIKSSVPISQYIAGDILFMNIELNQLVPIVRKTLYADPSYDAEIQNAIETTEDLYGTSVERTRKFLDKVRDSKLLQADIEPFLNQLVEAKQTLFSDQLNKLMPQSQLLVSDSINKDSMMHNSPQTASTAVNLIHQSRTASTKLKIRVAKVRLNSTNSTDGKKKQAFKKVKLVSPDGKLTQDRALLDTGAEINLVHPALAQQFPVKDKIVLSGLERGAIPSEVVTLDTEIEGIRYKTEAAIYPDLNQITKSMFLIGEPLWRSGSEKGVNWLNED